jgi:hypothetical protein|tara:strand:- start:17 stop:280 length:264 start_codon:yes stop_codon:yes gene_type:complete
MGMGEYDQRKKREYYLSNRKERLAYQNWYYRESKGRFQRRREIGELLEPELLEKSKQKLSDYNKEYYGKNRARILQSRADRRAGKSK